MRKTEDPTANAQADALREAADDIGAFTSIHAAQVYLREWADRVDGSED